MDEATKRNRYHYNKKLNPIAGVLRMNMTKAEACLWKYVLRAGMMKGYTFNRQRPVNDYIADFLCKKLRMVIEVDGITHSHEETYLQDKIKDTELEKVEFKVIRFSDEEVLKNIDGVRGAIESCVEQREEEFRPSSPSLPLTEGDKNVLRRKRDGFVSRH